MHFLAGPNGPSYVAIRDHPDRAQHGDMIVGVMVLGGAISSVSPVRGAAVAWNFISQKVFIEVVLQKSVPAQIRQLILHHYLHAE